MEVQDWHEMKKKMKEKEETKQVLGTKQILIPMDRSEFWCSTVNGSHYFVQNFELQEPRYETKQVLFWVGEKIELEKWVIRISLSYEI